MTLHEAPEELQPTPASSSAAAVGAAGRGAPLLKRLQAQVLRRRRRLVPDQELGTHGTTASNTLGNTASDGPAGSSSWHDGGTPGGAPTPCTPPRVLQRRLGVGSAEPSTAAAPLVADPGTRMAGSRKRRAAWGEGESKVTVCGSAGAEEGLGATARAAAEQPTEADGRHVPGPVIDPRLSSWTPPASPWGLVEEMLYEEPWRLLTACILLNRTTGRQVRRVLGPLWRAYPTAQSMAAADPQALQGLLRPLGLHKTRAAKLKRFSQEYESQQWTCPTELFGVGRYAADAYHIFCRGRWRDVQPSDKDLRRYRDWLQTTGGEGSGLEREDLSALLQLGG